LADTLRRARTWFILSVPRLLEVGVKVAFALVSALAIVACSAPAAGTDRAALLAEPASNYLLTWREDGALVLEAHVLVPNGCYHALGPARRGTPAHLPVIAQALAVQLPIGMTDGVCTMALKHVTFEAVFPSVPVDTVAVIVYELWPRGDPVRPRAVALPLQ